MSRRVTTRIRKRFVHSTGLCEELFSNADDIQSESEDSEAERQEEEDRKKAEEEKNKVNGEKAPSGTSSAGTNTPVGRAEKHAEPSKLPASVGNALKRPGSPNLSEASGSESSKKRHKKNANGTVSRAMSPSGDGRSLSRKSLILCRTT